MCWIFAFNLTGDAPHCRWLNGLSEPQAASAGVSIGIFGSVDRWFTMFHVFRSRVKRVVLTVLGIVVLGGVVGTGLALRSYDQKTKIDRTIAKVVVRQYIDAALVSRDNDRAALFSCKNPQLGEVQSLESDLIASEQANGYATQLVISRSTEVDGGKYVDVELQVNQGQGTTVRTRIMQWRFTLVDQDGWRVCGASRLPDPSPSPSVSITPTTPS